MFKIVYFNYLVLLIGWTVDLDWYLINARGKSLGRLASIISIYLQGKHKSFYIPYMNCGDNIVVINFQDVKLTGNKFNKKVYYSHSGYPGGLKKNIFKDVFERNPKFILYKAVKGMLPKNKMGKIMLNKLKVYMNDMHPHFSQNPKLLEVL